MSASVAITTLKPLAHGTCSNDEKKDDTEKSAIQRLSQGVGLSGIPSFTSMELKRQWMLQHLAGAFRVFARKGFVEGLTGHISLRDPGN
jgi:hypothetical protein